VLVRIVAPHFVAGIEATNGRVTMTAPILHYMRGWDGAQVASYCARKGWQWERIAP
jgi:hypothetical protein